MSDKEIPQVGERGVYVEGDVLGHIQTGDVIIHYDFVPVFQLPAVPDIFLGRQNEVNQLTAAVQDNGHNLVGVFGLPGVGKTALIKQVAHNLAENYPDGQIYLNAAGFSQHSSPHTLKDILSHIIRSFLPNQEPSQAEAQLKAWYRSIINTKRILVVLDNVKDSSILEALQPSENSALLVTSREHLTTPGLYGLRLKTLTPDSAKSLLINISPRVEEYATRLAELCAYLPLALQMTASILKTKSDISVPDYLVLSHI